MSEFVPYLGVPHYGEVGWPTCCSLLTASTRVHPLVVGEQGSLLTYVFNRLWAECYNLRARKDAPRRPTHFAMLHADASPDPGWLDVLHDELCRLDADVISVVSPIKDHRGITSTGVQNLDTRRIRRLTMHEVLALPETFDAVGAGYPGRALMVNTGCWLCRLDRPWVEDFPGFTILDGLQKIAGQRLPQVVSEDWNASRWWHDHGVKVYATRKVRLAHYGGVPYRNDTAWGSWKYDKGDGALVDGGEIEGWMSHDELDWLRAQAAARERVVEIGTWHGRSTKALAGACKGVVYTVDHFQGSPGDASFVLAEEAARGAGNDARAAFHENLKEELASGRVRLLEMDSVKAAGRFNHPGGYRAPDMVFLDGAHDTESVRRDIKAWKPLLARGGLLCGHDANDSRVVEALDELLPGWRHEAGSIWSYALAAEGT